jgi:predicted nucleic-acid-binding protein
VKVGIDTLLNEDPVQSPQAKALLSSLSDTNVGYVGATALAEIHWVLTKRYQVPKPELIATLRTLLNLPALEFESFEAILCALDVYEKANVDFPDALLVERNKTAGCVKTLTFDQRASSHIPLMELLQ